MLLYYSPVVTPRASRAAGPPQSPASQLTRGRAGPHMYLKKFSWCRKLPEK